MKITPIQKSMLVKIKKRAREPEDFISTQRRIKAITPANITKRLENLAKKGLVKRIHTTYVKVICSYAITDAGKTYLSEQEPK